MSNTGDRGVVAQRRQPVDRVALVLARIALEVDVGVRRRLAGRGLDQSRASPASASLSACVAGDSAAGGAGAGAFAAGSAVVRWQVGAGALAVDSAIAASRGAGVISRSTAF